MNIEGNTTQPVTTFGRINSELSEILDSALSARQRVECIADNLYGSLPCDVASENSNEPSAACDVTEQLLSRVRAQISGLHGEITRIQELA